jgi:two-component system sensor histidine kinase PilS (NtrC family)
MTAQTVLVIDDERDIRELLTITLGRMDLQVDAVGTVADARTALAERAYDLCFTDMRLPDGNGQEIIENILQLSRRERSRPETLDLDSWAQAFVEEYCQDNDIGADSLRVITNSPLPVAAVADPQQLQQVVWNLVQNALRYGRMPGEPARVMVVTRQGEHGVPVLEVIDRGPGIAPKVAAQIFEPFYTTHEYGTGLGLYLARQMSEANQAALEYVRVAGGGSCFRLILTPPAHNLTEIGEPARPLAR